MDPPHFWIALLDLTAFLASLITLVFLWIGGERVVSHKAKIFLGLLVFTSLYNLFLFLEWSGLTILLTPSALNIWDILENFTGALLPMWWAFMIYALLQEIATWELQSSETRYQDLYNNAPDMFISVDAATANILQCNRMLETVTGYTREDIVGRPILELYSVESQKKAQAALDTFRTTGKAKNVELQLQRRDGSTVDVVVNASAVLDKQGRVLYSRSVLRDITERKRAEEALQKEKVLNKELFKTTPAFIVAINAEGKTVMMNDTMCNALGYAPHEIKGVDYLATFVPEKDREALAEIFKTLCTSRESTVNENHVIAKDGRELLVEWHGNQVYNSQNKFEFFFGVGIDITARVQAETEREKLIAELEAKNAELERFTYTVSHDLKSPLITTKGFIGMLEQDLAEGNQELIAEDLQRISHATETMERLLEELLELSRIGRIVNPPEKVPMSDLTQEAISLLSGDSGTPNTEFEIDLDLPTVHGDRIRLREVLQNLIENGIKFRKDQVRPHIKIGFRKEKAEKVFYVQDNGIGIDPRYREKIFGLFDKLNSESAGSGIGLAIVKRIVEVHGGRIWAESEGIGHGSTFCFTLSSLK